MKPSHFLFLWGLENMDSLNKFHFYTEHLVYLDFLISFKQQQNI
jgi:hypothetical protein